ncbi:hypothetical protein CONLIGDRAFT_351518 [Coniochaeta ligniaria NRRL 30616]|uniref:Homeobox domain-containing protein n=1 Tax=Coniochaeta ligniaria NRRL 30616 TaxID=1408157 RepID=A0A1J7JJB5_9PEZI|nr:hypothetical protein CONLIGDRAFT_351518 [Coniochaeta ligniaria NRRL 30616]
MLVTRQCEPEQNHWSISKLETIFHKPSNSSRMSNNYEPPLSTQSDWQGQYSSFLPPGDTSIFSQPYDHVASSTEHSDSQAQPRSATVSNNPLDIENMKTETVSLGSPLAHRRSLDPLGLRQPKTASPIQEQPEEQGKQYSQKHGESIHDESLASTETPGMSLGSNPLSSVSSTGQTSDIPTSHQEIDSQAAIKDEDEEVLDDEEMIEGDGDGDVPSHPQTAAERTAQRRKMKRFRLTHQQTRFLMSEFAKQPHPDAAHRERLSREIPGLSPRQVQVWFQNRRAKIKRLTADDRDRMIKMRAVPDDFDNVQALHSPYGAVHGLGTPLTSPVDFGGSTYADHMMRPLMVDVRRSEGDEHLSPTGLSPAFGSIGFNPSTSLNNPDILSPMSTGSGDRYAYSNHMSTPLSAGPRTSNPYARQPNLDTSMSMHGHHGRHQIRPLQPLQLRETMTRSRSDSLQSPLRTSMSWKGDAIDYTTYHGGSQSPQMGGRQVSGYTQDQMSGNSTSALGGYDSSNYSSSTVQSPTHINYPNFQSSSMQNSQNRSRLRAASASLPLGLDLRNQFRSVGTGHNMQSTAHSPGPRTSSNAQIGGVSSSYSSYPSAPLTAPMDFLPRTPGFRSSGADYSMPQMSAPIAPSNDFAQAFQSMSGSSSRTPMRDTFGGGPLSLGQSQTSGERNDDYSQDRMGIKRKRSFTGPSSATSTGQSTYGNTT